MGSELKVEKTSETSWTGGWLSWTRQSDVMLRNAEKAILSCLKTAYKRFYVDIGAVVGQSDKIWTVSLNEESPKVPLVLLHGMGAGLAFWCPNLDAFAATRPVYAIDLLGFGRSSRPKFASDPDKVELQWVESVEEWRREVNLQEFVLLGHSLGGYIAKAYALKYPERVRHLILADPWGFAERPTNVHEKLHIPLWVRAVFTALQPLNPLWAVRAAGPAGKWLVSKTRPDIARKFAKYVPQAETVVPEYIYQCNSQTPSGESAFHTLMHGFGWAKNPMLRRAHELDKTLPVTVIYGSRSWMDNSTGQTLSDQRQGNTYVHVINGAGHHVYLDKPELFNKYVNETCARADEYAPRVVSQGDAATNTTSDNNIDKEGDKASDNRVDSVSPTNETNTHNERPKSSTGVESVPPTEPATPSATSS